MIVSAIRFVAVAGSIRWVKPPLSEELGEYFENDSTKDALEKRGIVFETEEELLDFLSSGSLVDITQQQLQLSDCENLTLTSDDFEDELQDPEYRRSYDAMQQGLEKGLALPAPIIIQLGSTYYGFAGNRRMNLAFNNNLPLKVWLVVA